MALVEKFGAKTKSGGGAADPAAISFLGHQRQFEDFVEALETDRDPFVNGVEARKAVEIILAIYQSAREGRQIDLPL
jgi:predicted dehydrogenase